ncbi:c2H2-type domain-containing protein [Trichonephila clavipes]|nr:c2H2-type domain-containing protein [Trichonephila clavipes]
MQSVEEFFENSDFPLNTQIFATSDFGDLTSSQLDSPFEDDAAEDKIFSCSDCNKFFKHKKNFKRHKKNVHGTDENRCNHCNKNFARSDSLKRHLKLHEVSRAKILENKRKRLNSSPQPGPSGYQTPAAKDRRDNTKSRTCLNTFETYTISTDLNFIKNLNGFLQNSKEEVVRIVENKSKEKKGIKWYVCAKVRFVRKTAETEEEKCESHFRSICEISLLNESPEKKKVTEAFFKNIIIM